MKGNKEKYFNFPVVLLSGFLVDSRRVLNDIYNYATYVKVVYYCELEEFDWVVNENIEKAVSLSDSYFSIKTVNKVQAFESGLELHNSIPEQTPKVGLSISVFFNYYDNDKTEFEKVTLLGFLAIKSILQNKAYCKVTNNFWLSRMDGKAKSISDTLELSEPVRKYATRKYITKIKKELILEWSLIHYSRYTRGFYVSLKMSLEDLVFQAEKKRKTRLEKNIKDKEKEAIKRAMLKLNKL